MQLTDGLEFSNSSSSGVPSVGGNLRELEKKCFSCLLNVK